MTGHKTTAQPDRFRVVCTECTWFAWCPGATEEQLRQRGWHHTHATKERA